MKRILYTLSCFSYGGINKITSVKSNYFVNQGNEVHVLCTLASPDLPGESLYDKRVIIHRIDQNRLDSFLRIPIIGRLLRFFYSRIKHLRVLLSVNPDVIVSTEQYLEPFSVVLLTFWKKRVLEFHGWYNNPKEVHVSLKDRMMFRFKFPFYKMVALTQKEAEKLGRLTGNRVMSIPNPLYTVGSKKSNCNNRRALMLVRFSPEKNLLNFLPYWQSVQSKYPDWKLDIFGTGEEEMEICHLISSVGLKTVHLHHYTTDPMKEMSESSIYLLPSTFEGFPLVIMESMSVGVPCVSFDCPFGPSEIIKDGEDGFLVPYLDYASFVDRVCQLMEKDSMRKEMGRKAQENIKRFNLEVIMKKWIDLFQSL